MRPLKLTAEGFVCFHERVEVNFEELELFAIAGPTGAGKSTLLDALTYALYGKTARLGASVSDTLYAPGATGMFVTLEFSTDKNTTYRVTRVSERKAGKNPKNETRIERLEADASWKLLPESSKIKETNSKLVELVGLDYEGFTRAVLLPQGAFDEFLRGNASERRKLLVSLLSLTLVERIQKMASERAKAAEGERRGIEHLLQSAYGGATPERRRELKEALAALETQQKGLSRERDETAERLRDLAEVKGLLEERAKVEGQLSKLATQEREMQELHRTLQRARDAALLTPSLENLDERQKGLETVKTREAACAEALARAEVALSEADIRLKEAEGAAARVPELTRQLEALAGVKPLLASLKAKGGSLALAERAPSHPYSDEAWEALNAQLHALPALNRARRDLGEAERRLVEVEGGLQEEAAGLETLQTTLQDILEQGKRAKDAFEKAQAALEAAEVEDRAAALRAHVHLGEPCPVCHQRVSELPEGGQSRVVELQRVRDEAQTNREALQERYLEVKGRLDTSKSRLADRQEARSRAEAEVKRRRVHLSEAETPFIPLGTTDPDELSARLQAARLDLLAGLARTVKERAHGLDPDLAHAKLSAERKRLEAEHRAAGEVHRKAQEARNELRSEHTLLVEQRRERFSEVEAAAAAFEKALSSADFSNADEVRSAALPEARVQVLGDRLKSYEAQREALGRRGVELQAKLAGRTLDEAVFEGLQARAAELERSLTEVQQNFGGTVNELEHLDAQLEQTRGLRERMKGLDREYSTYQRLNRDLHSDAFPDFLISRVQATLAARASGIIREVTEGRYDLYFSGGEYHVLDAWHGGELRSAKTLSGGESFITSLALALALSDTLAGSRALGALFLDEGFGTLDAETLHSVTEVLEALSAKGRMVGVITHVTALSERLPDRLLVTKGPEGSTVAWDV